MNCYQPLRQMASTIVGREMMRVLHRLAVLAASTALASGAAPAFAQNAPVPSNDQAAPTATDATDEIVITANKREERLQDVPISVTVIGGGQISNQNINEVTDLVRSAPALNSAGPFGALSIRGVGSIAFARSAEG